MRLLADESCDFVVVRALRSAGHDVTAVAELQQRSIDEEVMEAARTENRVLLTEDKDFGWLAFVKLVKSAGDVLIRFPAPARSTLGDSAGRGTRSQTRWIFCSLAPRISTDFKDTGRMKDFGAWICAV